MDGRGVFHFFPFREELKLFVMVLWRISRVARRYDIKRTLTIILLREDLKRLAIA